MTKAAAQPQKKLNDKYILGDEIGKGAYGRVYKGLDMENGDFVAIKQVSLKNIPQEDLNIIMQEIDLLKNLNHKNIVKYMGSVKTKTHLNIILEYIENGSLASIVKPNKFGAFPESLVAVYITQVLEGLVYLHEQGVIHRDIKGANILTTKEGLVKLADFGVATTLTEADVNTYSVAGTPYWMAPEVIELSGVSAASDIWSVGCTVIELLTCEPPYFDLQPMPALFRIVQDDHPPIPDHLSPGLTDFLHQCFQKDAKSRPDAKTLLMHPWIQNSRKDLQSSLQRTGVRIRNMPQQLSTVVERTIEDGNLERCEGTIATGQDVDNRDNKNGVPKTHSGDIQESFSSPKQQLSSGKNAENEIVLEGNSFEVRESGIINSEMLSDVGSNSNFDATEVDGDVSKLWKRGSKLDSYKAGKSTAMSTRQELSRISNITYDEILDDLFEDHLYHQQGLLSVEASTSTLPLKQQFSHKLKSENSDLAADLKARMAERQSDDKSGKRCGSNLLSIMLNVVDDGVAGLDGIVMKEKFPGKDTYHVQALELCRLVSMLKPEESEDNIVSACRKLFAVFEYFPEQKMSFLTQHGLVRLMEMLEVTNNWVVISVLQFINLLTNENAACMENACLTGLIPVVMNLASPDRSQEVRMQAAYFVQNLCQISTSTLQMFIACRGLPVLVRFLEPDYSKCREMVHIAIDCMWCVFNLKTYTLRNYFCHLLAKNGVLNRLVNTLHSLNEAAHLASSAARLVVTSENGTQQLRPGSYEAVTALSKNNDTHRQSVKERGQPDLGPQELAQMEEKLSRQHSILSTQKVVMEQSWRQTQNSNGRATSQNEPAQPLLSLLENEPSKDKISPETDMSMHLLSGANKVPASQVGVSTLDYCLQTASGALSGSGVLNARPGSATSSGILSQMTPSLNADVAREYLEKVANLLLEFSRADTTVKLLMCTLSLLMRLFQMLNKLESSILLKILKCINQLSTDPNCLEYLQRADAIKHLLPNLQEGDGPFVPEIHMEALNALNNLCKINKRRQEQAAENGIIPHLMRFIVNDSPLKVTALPLLCDMAHASRYTREQLRMHNGLDVYLSLLDDEAWSITALDSIAVCLAHDNDHRRVEQVLVRKEAVHKLVNFFRCCSEQNFVHVLEPFLKIVTKSIRINTILAVSGLTPLLVARLDHQDAIARLNLLKLIKAVYEHHPRPKELIVENDLPLKLKNLIEEKGRRSGGQVLVKQMATALLKALHLNRVL